MGLANKCTKRGRERRVKKDEITDICTPSELSTHALHLIALSNTCKGETLRKAMDEVAKYADSDYYEEQEMLNQIVMWMKQKL